MAKEENLGVHAARRGISRWGMGPVELADCALHKMKFPRIFVWLDRHKKQAWIIPVLLIMYWVYDRTQIATDIIDQEPYPTVVAGEELRFTMRAYRHVGRECSITLTRTLLDSNGYTRPYTVQPQTINADGIRDRDAATPGYLLLKFPIPASMPTGLSQVNTDTLYTCATNPLTIWWPVRETYTWPFIVVPEKPKVEDGH